MIISDGLSGAARSTTLPVDHCRHSSALGPEYAGCVTFQPTSLAVMDSMGNPLPAAITCRHLGVGVHPEQRGRYYPRCGLGSASERVRWLAAVTPQRAAVARVLADELELAARHHRDGLLQLRAASGAGATPPDHARAQEHARELLKVWRAVIRRHATLLEEIGVDEQQLLLLVEEQARSIAANPWLEQVSSAVHARSAMFPPIAQALLSSLGCDSPATAVSALSTGADAADGDGVDAPGALRCIATDKPRGIAFIGDIDASNAAVVSDHLSRVSNGGGDVHVDLSGVVFCDVAGLRALVSASEALEPGGRLIVHGMGPQLRRAKQVAGWGELTTLVDADAASWGSGRAEALSA